MASLSLYDLIPILGAVITLISVGLKAGRILQKLDNVIDDVNELRQDIKELKKEVKEHGERLTALEANYRPSPKRESKK